MNRKGATAMGIPMILGLLALVAVVGWYFGSAKPVAQYTGYQVPFEAGGGAGAGVGLAFPCETSGLATNSYSFAAKNVLDSSATNYGAATINLASAEGTFLNTGTGTAAATITWTAITVPCGGAAVPPVYAYALSANAVSFGAGGKALIVGKNTIIPTGNASEAVLLFESQNGDNDTSGSIGSPSGGAAGSLINSTAHAMSAGSTYSGIITMYANETFSKIGAENTYIVVNYYSNIFSGSQITVNGAGFVRIACPSWVSYVTQGSGGGQVCFVRPSYSVSDGTQDIRFSVQATGNPTTSTPVTFNFVGDAYTQYDGAIKLNAYNDAGVKTSFPALNYARLELS